MIKLTNEKQRLRLKAKTCYICKRKFLEKYDKDKIYGKVRDHSNYTGRYLGVAHSICNL